MIAIRKEIEAFDDFNNRELIEVENPHLLVVGRYHPNKSTERVLITANFSNKPQPLNLENLDSWTVLQQEID